MTATRVLLVRDWQGTTSGSQCCSTGVAPADLFGPALQHHDSDGGQARACRQGTGEVYRSLRRECPDVDVTVVDSDNWLWLLPTVVQDGRRAGLTWTAAAREAVRATTPGSLVVDGVVVARGMLPTPAEAVELVRRGPGTRPIPAADR